MKRSVTTRLGLCLASLALGVLLLANLRAPEDIAVSGASTGGGSSTATTGGGSTPPGSTPPASTLRPNATSSTGGATPRPTSSAGSTSGTKTFTGSLVDTRYGPVQVQITVSNGKITNVSATQLPNGGRSGNISAYAAPILSGEAMAAQSAQINLVSGATYTSSAYEQSLQAALDQAGI
jgi:uncharacterized protein with FMN-binding domain